jgi:hypothetical protein
MRGSMAFVSGINNTFENGKNLVTTVVQNIIKGMIILPLRSEGCQRRGGALEN